MPAPNVGAAPCSLENTKSLSLIRDSPAPAVTYGWVEPLLKLYWMLAESWNVEKEASFRAARENPVSKNASSAEPSGANPTLSPGVPSKLRKPCDGSPINV